MGDADVPMKEEGADDAASDDGSEDLEAESSGSDEEEEEEAEEGADEDMEMGDVPAHDVVKQGNAPELMAH